MLGRKLNHFLSESSRYILLAWSTVNKITERYTVSKALNVLIHPRHKNKLTTKPAKNIFVMAVLSSPLLKLKMEPRLVWLSGLSAGLRAKGLLVRFPV